MTTRLDREQRYASLVELLDFHFMQRIAEINTALPGTVVEYDAEKRRAKVQPSLRVTLADGTVEPYPIIVNVPVLSPACGDVMITYGLTAGDHVLLIFSQSGLDTWKKELATEPAQTGVRFDIADAIALPGFGPNLLDTDFKDASDQSIPSSTDGVAPEENRISIQSKDGTQSITVAADKVIIRGNIHLYPSNGMEIPSGTPVRVGGESKIT